MKKTFFFMGFILIFSVAPIVFVVMECQRHLEEQYVFLLERKRVAIIGLGEELYRLSSEEFRNQLICEIYDNDNVFKGVIEGRSERFLRSANVIAEGVESRSEHVYDLYELSESDLVDLCGDPSK